MESIMFSLKKLSDLCELITKGTTPTTLGHSFTEKGIPFLRVQNIEKESVAYKEKILYISENTHQLLKRSQINSGDVLVAIAGTIGRIGIVPTDAPPLNCNQAIAILRPKKELFNLYLRYWLENSDAQRQMKGASVTGTISNLSLSQLGNLVIPVPSLSEQQRIAAVLCAADALCQKRRETLAWLEQLVQSTFYEMFGDPLENPKGWPVIPVSDFVANFESGKSITASNLQEETDYRVLKISAVTGNSFNPAETKPLPQDYIPPKHHLVQSGDLLFSRANTSELVGATAYVFDTEPNIALPDKIWRFKWKEPKVVSPLFCWILFSNPFIQHQIANNASGSSGSMKNISQAKMMQMEVICPPIELQNRFETALMDIQIQQKALKESLQNLESLFDSLMYHAFQGHLVFSDEGIENLMAQMQAEVA